MQTQVSILLARPRPPNMESSTKICIPGMKIMPADENHLAGGGTYTRSGYICSGVAGVLACSTENDKVTVSVKTKLDENLVPSVGTVVSAKVTNVNPRFCKCAILSVGSVALRETFRGVVRKEDVRATEKDKVEMYKSFRPGDVILARVLSLGDALSYLLTTTENELGVVTATSESGIKMVPISWNEMQCPKTLAKEHRKVARVQSQYIEYSKS